MKTKMVKLFAGLLVCCTVLGSTVNVRAEEAQETETSESTDTGAAMISYLTGEIVPESIGKRRPVAVMLGNSSDAVPQSGIGNAGVIYEAPVEGGITRLMGIFEDYDQLEKIGTVRSCRDYYIFYANEFDAIYAHYGQAVYALQYLDQHIVANLNGMTLENAYFRTNDRPAPHNVYTNLAYLNAGIAAMGYRQNYEEDHTSHYQFAEMGNETTLSEGADAQVVALNNFTNNTPRFEYDVQTGDYNRFQYGTAQTDALTGQQLTCDNIILQYSAYQNYDANGYLNIDTTSGGKGKFITRGKAIDITWQKDSLWGVTHYYDADQQEILLNPGKTWVEIIPNDAVDAVSIQ